MKVEQFFKEWISTKPNLKTEFHDAGIEAMAFADAYHKKQLSIQRVSNRLYEMEVAGKEATSLIAHLKDQHGFNDEEQATQDKVMAVFKYEGRW